jgi:hyperosmotically inducible periplasmic protein
MKRLALVLLLLSMALINGCAYTGYSIYDDQRLMGTISDDKELSAKIKTALLDESFSGGWSVAVYSFYGHVFLVGEVPENMQDKAVTIANRYKPRTVTTHWFTPATSETSNIVLATKLRTDLIGTKGLSSTRIDTEVNSGRVVLLGVVKDESEKQLAIQAARGVAGVTTVTSYLMLPQKAGQLDNIQPEHAAGVSPMDGSMEPSGSGSTPSYGNPSGSAGGSSGSGSGNSGRAGGVESRDLP